MNPHPVMYGAPPPAPPQPPPVPARRRWLVPALVGGTAVAALTIGALLGAVFTGGSGADTASPLTSQTAAPTADPAPSAAEVHAQDVSLCTSYAVINSATPRPDLVGSDLLPTVTALKVALAENPHASADVREAVTNMTEVYYARVAEHGKVRTRGLAEPPPYSLEDQKEAVDRVWVVCGLDEE